MERGTDSHHPGAQDDDVGVERSHVGVSGTAPQRLSMEKRKGRVNIAYGWRLCGLASRRPVEAVKRVRVTGEDPAPPRRIGEGTCDLWLAEPPRPGASQRHNGLMPIRRAFDQRFELQITTRRHRSCRSRRRCRSRNPFPPAPARARRCRHSARSAAPPASGCSTKLVEVSRRPGISTLSSGRIRIAPHRPFMLVTRIRRLERDACGLALRMIPRTFSRGMSW